MSTELTERQKELVRNQEQNRETLRSALGSAGIEYENDTDKFKATRSGAAKIEFVVYDVVDHFSARTFKKTEFGGYKIDKEAPCRGGRRSNQQIRSVQDLKKVIDYFLSLPVVKKTKSRPKDDRNSILQNAMVRSIQSKSHSSLMIHSLAQKESDGCWASFPSGLKIMIYPNRMDLDWSCQHESIKFQPSSPGFNPDCFVDAVVRLEDKLCDLYRQIRQAGRGLGQLNKVSGL